MTAFRLLRLTSLAPGVGETVLVVHGSSARGAVGDMSIPVDATVVGIVDGQDVDVSVLTKERKDGSD